MRNLCRGTVLLLVLLVATSANVLAQGARFSGPPVIGDREVTWAWEAIPGLDPYFQGNTVLDLKRTIDPPVPEPVRLMRINQTADLVYGVGRTDNRIFVWDAQTGALQKTLEAPPAQILDFDVHRSEQRVLAGLGDGRIAVWDLRESLAPSIVPAQNGPCQFIRYIVSSTDLNEIRFITAGADEVTRVWDSPGTLRREIRTAGQQVTALGLTSNGAFLALGASDGVIRIFQPLQSDQAIRRLEGHDGALGDIVFSVDRARMISADATGKLIAWSTATWTVSFELNEVAEAAPKLGVRDPDGALIYTLDAEGVFRIYDGFDGRLYRQADLIQDQVMSGAAYGNFGREVSVATEDGRLRSYLTGFCQPSLDQESCFGGYMIWRSPTPNASDAVLLRIYGFGDSTWSFAGIDRTFTDPDSILPRASHSEEALAGPHNGLPYYYSVTAFQRSYLNGSVFDVLLNSVEEGFYRDDLGDPAAVATHAPAREERPLLSRVIVVPNPYEAGKVPWDSESGAHVEFRNLPEQATIHIYTIAGDLTRVLRHGAGVFGESSDTQPWDLRNDQGEEVTSGVYIYHVTTSLNAEDTKGYFLVIR